MLEKLIRLETLNEMIKNFTRNLNFQTLIYNSLQICLLITYSKLKNQFFYISNFFIMYY